jgi:hypothetical protein
MYNLRENHGLQAKFASLARKIEPLELKKKVVNENLFKKLCVKFVKLMTINQ